jgi:hypothetical protein
VVGCDDDYVEGSGGGHVGVGALAVAYG